MTEGQDYTNVAYGSIGGDSSSHLNFSNHSDLGKLSIENTWTRITTDNELLLHVYDQEFRYPSPSAQAMDLDYGARKAMEARIEVLGQSVSAWDGWIRLLRKPKKSLPYLPTGLLSRMLALAEKFDIPIEIDDKRDAPTHTPSDRFDKIPLRDYQQDAVDGAIKAGRGVMVMPPRGGKTRTMLEIHRVLNKPTIWMAPTSSIVTQTVKAAKEWFGKDYAYHLKGNKYQGEAAGKELVICTAAMAAGLSKEFYETRAMVVIDEWHHAAAKSYKTLWKQLDHIHYRYGMTGTNFRSGTDGMAMESLLSNVVSEVTAEELVRRGFLVPGRVVFLPVLAPRIRVTNGMGHKFNGGFGKVGIHEHEWRNQLAAYAAVELFRAGRKVLILVGTKAQGGLVQKAIEPFLPTPPTSTLKTVEFVSTDVRRPQQEIVKDNFLDDEGIVKILIGTSLLGEGVDLPSVDALVYARGEKAEVSLTQNAYRVSTAIPGKIDSIIVDFADRHSAKLLKHSKLRMKVYHEESTFSPEVLPDPHQFADWLKKGATAQ